LSRIINFEQAKIAHVFEQFSKDGVITDNILENINPHFHFQSDIDDVLNEYSDRDRKRFYKILTDIKEAVKQMTSDDNMNIRFQLEDEYFELLQNLETNDSEYKIPSILIKYRKDINPIRALKFELQEIMSMWELEDDYHKWLVKQFKNKDKINSRALDDVEQNGIVFIDEIDKITSRADRTGADVSREGVQRDLLPLIEGTAVTTKYGVVKTDYILFIASGAFHLSKPSDMLPELQGRLPIRVELDSLSKKDFKLILTETQNSLIKQYQGLLGTEKVDLKFEEDGIDTIASLSTEINQNVENIGARRLHTVMEKLLEEVSYTASDIGPTEIIINKEYVENSLGELIKSQDLSKFIL